MSIIMHNGGGDTAGCGGAGEIEVDDVLTVSFGDPEKDPSKGSGQDEICDDPLLLAPRVGDDEELDELFETIGGPRVLALC